MNVSWPTPRNIFISTYKIKPLKITFCTFVILLFTIPSFAPADEIKAIFDKAMYRHAHFGLHVVDMAKGETVYALNSDRLLYPASLTKLFVTASALSRLGRDFTFKTALYRRGSLKQGSLLGDLILVPTGDIFFSGLEFLAQQVKAAGIREVRGDILVDDRLFLPYRAYSTVSPGLVLYTVSPAMCTETQLGITITPTRPGKKAQVKQDLALSWPGIMNETRTVPKEDETQIEISWTATGKLRIKGKISTASTPLKKSVAIYDPASCLRALFINALQRKKVKVAASPLRPNPRPFLSSLAEDKDKLSTIAVYQSPPLNQYIQRILETSYNPGADALVLLLGCLRALGTMEEGMKVIREFLKEKDLDLKTVSLGDGAGISPANLVTPQTVTAFLAAIARDEIYRDMLNALPVLGVSGTLKWAVDDKDPAQGKIRAKTGTLNQYDVLNNSGFVQGKSLAGYVETASGRKLAFCVIINHVHETDRPTRPQVMKLAQEVGEDLVRIAEILYRNY
ncbi:MAG TPA: D-alanyl-D-alanine carboxypeptidase/D-alanyl-D-alanine-endopeptidase [Syntrophales bacterium]|nr:D-alanyl-D-alanine carboxypeptidase/D-alanyl-D-alanine-endopeptidase [Syntrophales bacterium]HOL58416.1 D-alanyl-D-alanine carboxypeptidase/D-alanyl-D-alanine-endopeptidase [Syntrophales bacterium]HPO34585.1 D-alanyl-D-alanine carboxypeptidase/D-alanyl-D-alanine-endopeptidase [Syntrophales bacterium]